MEDTYDERILVAMGFVNQDLLARYLPLSPLDECHEQTESQGLKARKHTCTPV